MARSKKHCDHQGVRFLFCRPLVSDLDAEDEKVGPYVDAGQPLLPRS